MKTRLIALFITIGLMTPAVNVAASSLDEPIPETSDILTSYENLADISVQADSAILIDATTGTILYDKNKDKEQYPASITKLMTVLLALEYGKLDETITFSEEAVFGIERNSSHIALDVGEEITMEQALYAIMLQSANEAALGVAEHIAGSKEAFAQMMTERAKELGATHTNFVNPNGLHDDNHYTSAYDMALIAKELLKFDYFRELMATTYYEIPPTNKQPETRYLYGQHKMQNSNSSFYYEGCEGGKPGFTNEALNTLVTYAKRGDTELIAVVLKDTGTNIYSDTITLFNYGFEHYETLQLFSANEFNETVPVFQSVEDQTLDAGNASLIAANDIYATVPKGTTVEDLERNIFYEESIAAPASEGTVEGVIEYSLNGQLLGRANLVLASAVTGLSEAEIHSQIMAPIKEKIKTYSILAGIVIVCLIILYLIISHIIDERKRKKRRQRFQQKYRSKY